MSSFAKELLPPPTEFYRAEFGHLPRPSRGWSKVRCIFHDDKTPSLSLHLSSGGFHCFSCGTSGGDIVDFVKLRDSIDFRQAAISLGACRDEQTTAQERKEREIAKREKERIRKAAENLRAEEHRLKDGGPVRVAYCRKITARSFCLFEPPAS